jgi:hypothetical protein
MALKARRLDNGLCINLMSVKENFLMLYFLFKLFFSSDAKFNMQGNIHFILIIVHVQRE